MAEYDLILTDDNGTRLTSLNDAITFTASRTADGFGELVMQLPVTFDDSLINREFVRDRMVQLWRKPFGLWNVYFIREFSYETADDGRDVFTISGPDKKELLRRRIVAEYAASSEAAKTDYADDMMKEIVTESLSDGGSIGTSSGTRVWSDFSIGAGVSLGPSLTRNFAYRQLATANGTGVLFELQKAARAAGTEVFFDVLVDEIGPPIKFIFETTINQPGQDKTSGANSVIFSQKRGNLKNPRLTYNYRNELSYVYAAGQGQGSGRNIQQVSDAARYDASKWNRREGFADARQQASDNAVRDKGRELLDDGRPRVTFSGQAVDVIDPKRNASTEFGKDWDYGDAVKATYRNITIPAIVRAVGITKNSDGSEQIQVRLNFEGAI